MKTSKKSAVFLTDALKKNFIFPLGIIVCIVFSALLSSVMPIFFQRVIDNLARLEFPVLALYVVIIMIIPVICSLLDIGKTKLSFMLTNKVGKAMREALYDHLLNIIEECEKAGNPDMVYEFVSTSKVSYPGAGIAALISSEANIKEAQEYMNFQIIGHDKLNQLRHVKFFQNLDGVMNQMKKHAEILRPKFEAILQVMDQELSGLDIASWTKPNGGYFISFDAMEGCAKKIVAKAKEAGLTMTGAGATYPYHNDPQDSNIRIAPSFPTPEELEIAGQVFVLSVKLVSVDKILESK